MQVYNYGKFPNGLEYTHGEICEFSEYDLNYLEGFDRIYYWYASAPYEGMGEMIGLLNGKWYVHSCGHCSCFGPLEHIYIRAKQGYDSLDELEKKCSGTYLRSVQPLLDMARSMKEPVPEPKVEFWYNFPEIDPEPEDQNAYLRRMRQETTDAFVWIRNNNSSISDEILDLMYTSALREIGKIEDKGK